jgi:hypothetical protein
MYRTPVVGGRPRDERVFLKISPERWWSHSLSEAHQWNTGVVLTGNQIRSIS